MSEFTFLHAADLHLDSPLLGLAAKSADFAERVEQASRRAFDNLVALAIAEGCHFVILAGDTFDGDLREFRTGLYFLSGMARLRDAGIRVFLIAGNHDAENRFADKLAFSSNVHRFEHKKAETVPIDELGVALHGRSFGQRDITENIALAYPPASPGVFNIGILHTACAGSEGPHAAYAPCSLEQLVNHGYHYWALGHVHTRAVLNKNPHIVYPGNLQGRSPRETGAKGATLVKVSDGIVVSCDHHDLDEVRWASVPVDVADAADHAGVLQAVRSSLDAFGQDHGHRPLALRLILRGATALHGQIVIGRRALRDDVEALLATMSSDIWLEKLDLRTDPPAAPAASDPTVAGRLVAEVRRLGAEPGLADDLDAILAEVRTKIPAAARADELFEHLRDAVPGRAIDLAASLVERTGV